MDEGRWITYNGRRIFINTNKYMNSYIRKDKKDTTQELKDLIGNYGKTLQKDNNMRYQDGKLIRKTKVGERAEPDKAVRNAGIYKIYARHFDTTLPYTHYYIANTKTNEVFSIPEVITEWNSGVLKEITDNIINGGPPKIKSFDYNPFEGI